MTHRLEINYRDARLRVDVTPPEATLFINNVARDRRSLATPTGLLHLSSTVQTDYEWHEYVEAVVAMDHTTVTIEIRANNETLAQEETAA